MKLFTPGGVKRVWIWLPAKVTLGIASVDARSGCEWFEIGSS